MRTVITRAMVLAWSTVLFIALGSELAHAGDCPQTCFKAGSPSSCSVVARRDTSTSWSFSATVWGNALARYDLTAGSSYVEADHSDEAQVQATDRYTIVGPPAGTLVSIVAHLALSGYAQINCVGSHCAVGEVTATLADSGGNSVSLTSPISSSPTLDLPLTQPAGVPFVLTWTTDASGSTVDFLGADAAATAAFRFDLSPGVGIASCEGYTSGLVTATNHESWGTIKVRYR